MTERGPEAEMRVSDYDLVFQYQRYVDRGDGEMARLVGEEVMTRLLGRVGLGDRAQEILYKDDGSKLTGPEGQELRAVDYMEVARQHGLAEKSILNFIRLDESHPKYDVFKSILLASIVGHLPSQKPENT